MLYQDKLEQLEKSYEELEQQMADPQLISDGDAYRKAAKRRSDFSAASHFWATALASGAKLKSTRTLTIAAKCGREW